MLLEATRSTIRRGLREPGQTLLLLAIVAISTGAATTVYTLVDALLLDPPPYAQAHRLVQLDSWQGDTEAALSMRELDDLRRRTDLFADLAVYIPPFSGYTLADGEGPPYEASAVLVSRNLFSVLGSPLLLGAPWPESYDRERSFGVVLSDRLYRSHFAGDPAVLERTLTLDGAPNYRVFGVAAPDFDFPLRTELYRSLVINERWPDLEKRDVRMVRGVARLRDGVSLKEAEARVAAVGRQLADEFPDTNRGVEMRLTPLEKTYTGNLERYLWILGLCVATLVVIGCVNAANLLLARSWARQPELAMRSALGASRARLVTWLLTETLLSAGLGTALGLVVAHFSLRSLVRMVRFDLPRWVKIEMDHSVWLFAFTTAIVVALLCGLLPALRGAALGSGASRPSGGRALSRGLVVVQLAAALAVLAMTATLLGSFRQLARSDLGFQVDDILTFKVSLPWYRYTQREPEKIDTFHRSALAALSELPGTTSVALTTDLPLTVGAEVRRSRFLAEGQGEQEAEGNPTLRHAAVSPGFFATAGVPILAGREFTVDDRADTAPVLAVSERVAERLWPGEDPIGKRIRPSRPGSREALGADGEPWWEVVAVVGDVRRAVNDSSWQEDYSVYSPAEQVHPENVHYVVRSERAQSLVAEVEQAIWKLDPLQPLWDVETMSLRKDTQLWREKALSRVVSAFAVAAVLLAAGGIYAVMTFSVRRRFRELGVRIALGAGPGGVLAPVLREAGAILALGLLFGSVLAGLGSRLLPALLPAVAPLDGTTLLGMGAVLVVVVALALVTPLRQVLSVDPIRALRED